MEHIVIQTESLPDKCSSWLETRCKLFVCGPETQQFQDLLPLAHGIVIRTYTTITRSIIESAPSLKVIARAGVGVDNIDLEACEDHGITVVNTPQANQDSVAEFVISRLLSKLRRTTFVIDELSQEDWNHLRQRSITAREFSQIKLGIIGFGGVGQKLGNLAAHIGFNVSFHDIKRIPCSSRFSQCSLEEILHDSNVISIHVDGRSSNKHFCNSSFFKKIKTDCLFVNTSRGFVVDAYALANYLDKNPLALALVDVHDPEPIVKDYPLLNMPNAELYPHIASKTENATMNMGWVVRDLVSVLNNETPKFSVYRH